LRRVLVVSAIAALVLPAAAEARDFPRGFLWGTAISGFQTEAGGRPSNADMGSDWWVWSHDRDNIEADRVSGDLVERGPGHWRLHARDARLARRRLGANAFRFSIEWSRVFPRSTAGARTPRQLDRLADPAAVRGYAAQLRAIRRHGMEPVLTLNHFTLPTWLHDPIAVRDAFAGAGPDESPPSVERGGWLNGRTVREFRKFAAVHRHDRRARVGPVHNMIAFTPADPADANDRAGAGHADYIFNRIFLNAVVRGHDDRDVDGRIEPGERRRDLRGRADFIGLNYYFRSRVTGLGAPASTTVPLFDFLPTNTYAHPQNPAAPPCPTTCTEFGWEVFPRGFRRVLGIAGSYGLPVYVTENGLADGDDDMRRDYLLSHLRALRGAMRDRLARVKGYFAWSLVDNFEWAAGYYPRFGFFSYNADTLARRARPSARLFRRIARSGTLP
jgi:beta-galactosidase